MVALIVLLVLVAAFIALVIWGPKKKEAPAVPPEICVPDQPTWPDNPEDWEPAPDPGPIDESDNLDDLLDEDGNIK